MGEARIEPRARLGAGPAPARGLGSGELLPRFRAVPMVELMGGNGLPGTAEQVVFFGCEVYITKACQLPRIPAGTGEEAHHRRFVDGLRQVHEAAALRNGRQARRQGFPDRSEHRTVAAQLPRVKLRVAASQVKARRLNGRQRWLLTGAFLLATVVLYFILLRFDRSAADGFLRVAVLIDVIPLVCNIIGQGLMSTAYMEQWLFWMGVNVTSIILWCITLRSTPDSSYALVYVIKYVFYLLNSINGLRIWLRISRG